jgi:hypothetical protein
MKTVPLVAILFDPATGRRVEHREDLNEEYIDSQEYMWTEGNFSCDCNKRLCMLRALGEDDTDAGPCGDTIVLERLTVNGDVVVGQFGKATQGAGREASGRDGQ